MATWRAAPRARRCLGRRRGRPAAQARRCSAAVVWRRCTGRGSRPAPRTPGRAAARSCDGHRELGAPVGVRLLQPGRGALARELVVGDRRLGRLDVKPNDPGVVAPKIRALSSCVRSRPNSPRRCSGCRVPGGRAASRRAAAGASSPPRPTPQRRDRDRDLDLPRPARLPLGEHRLPAAGPRPHGPQDRRRDASLLVHARDRKPALRPAPGPPRRPAGPARRAISIAAAFAALTRITPTTGAIQLGAA
jgi:hypothetical protein